MSSYNPTQNLFGTAHYSEDALKVLFLVNPANELAQNPVFSRICESLVAHEFATDSKLKERLGIPRKRSFNTSGDTAKRLQLIEEFKEAVTKTDNIPPSPLAQYARPAEEPELPDWLRKAEARLQHTPA